MGFHVMYFNFRKMDTVKSVTDMCEGITAPKVQLHIEKP